MNLTLNVPDSLTLDVDNSYLSFVDNNPISKDTGEYRILHFIKVGMTFSSVFKIENSAPPKFCRLQLVFWNKIRNKHDPISEEYNLILDNNLLALKKNGSENIFIVYFNDSNSRDIILLDLLGRKIKTITNITSGDEIDVGSMVSGIYFFSIENFATKIVKL